MSETKVESVRVQIGPGFLGSLFIAFLVLKLTKVIDWSWWWVSAPLWGPLAIFISAFTIILVFAIIMNLVDALTRNGK